jgi:hypothetical protein
MPTQSEDTERRMVLAIQAKTKGDFLTWAGAACHSGVSSAVFIARSKGRLPNASKGGRNTRLDSAEDTALKLYCKRCILAGANPERQHIRAAANSILCTAGKPPVSKPWLTRWLNRNKTFLNLDTQSLWLQSAKLHMNRRCLPFRHKS